MTERVRGKARGAVGEFSDRCGKGWMGVGDRGLMES